MRMHSPSRSGDIVGNMIKELMLTVTDASKYLGVSRQTLNNLINNDNASVSSEMAVRLEAVLVLRLITGSECRPTMTQPKFARENPRSPGGLKRFAPTKEAGSGNSQHITTQDVTLSRFNANRFSASRF